MSLLKCHILELGEISVPRCTLLRGAGREPIWVPVRAALLLAGTRRILFDTGSAPDSTGGETPSRWIREQTLEAQLGLHGLSVGDVDTVVLSHLHGDHAGGAWRFSGVPVYVPAEDLLQNGADAPRLDYKPVPVGGDFALLPGLELLTLPGHTPNLLGLLAETEEGTLLLPSDAVYTPLHLGPPVRYPEYCAYETQYAASVARVRELSLERHARIVWFHWPVAGLE